jgi:hypothetical protein
MVVIRGSPLFHPTLRRFGEFHEGETLGRSTHFDVPGLASFVAGVGTFTRGNV